MKYKFEMFAVFFYHLSIVKKCIANILDFFIKKRVLPPCCNKL